MAKNFSLALNMILNSAEYTQGLNKMQGVTQSWANKLTGFIAGAFAISSITSFVKSAIAGYNETAQANAKMNAVLISTQGIAGVTAESIKKMTAGLSDKTLFSKTALTDAAAVLLIFTKIGKEAFPQVLQSAANMSTVFGTDLQSSIIKIGKAMNSPAIGLKALTRSAGLFTETQQEMIKKLERSGDLMGAQKLILAELKTKFDGTAEAAAKAGTGPIEMITKKFMALKKAVGEAIITNDDFQKSLIAIADTLNDVVYSALNNNMSEMESWQVLLEAIFGSSDGGKEVKAMIDFYKTQENLGIDDVSIKKKQQAQIEQDQKDSIQRQVANEKDGKLSKDLLRMNIRDLEDEVTVSKPKKFDDPGADIWIKKAKQLKVYKDLYDELLGAEKQANKPKGPKSDEELENEKKALEEAAKVRKDAYDKQITELDNFKNRILISLTDRLTAEYITESVFKDEELALNLKYLQLKLAQEKNYGQDSTKTLLEISQARLKIMKSDLMSGGAIGGNSVKSNIETPKQSNELKGLGVGGSVSNAIQKVAEVEQAQARLDKLNNSLKDWAADANNALASFSTETITASFTALAESVVGVGDGFKDFGYKVLQAIGQFLIKMGEQMVITALLFLAFDGLIKNPATAWIALGVGVAAIAAGAMFSAMGKKGLSGSGASSGGGGSSASSSNSGYSNSKQEDPKVVFEIKGTTLVGVLDNLNTRKNNFK